MSVNNPDHMTQVAAMLKYGGKSLKIFFSGKVEHIATKLAAIGTREIQRVYKS